MERYGSNVCSVCHRELDFIKISSVKGSRDKCMIFVCKVCGLKVGKIVSKIKCADCGSEDYPYHREYCTMGETGWG